jgi:pimeloyl-ACP methyl ester carboxylesterase
MDLLLAECAGDAVCQQAFPNVRAEWNDLLARLAAEPARVAYVPMDGNGAVPVEVRADIFAEKLRSLMYSPAGARQVPLIIHQAAKGDFHPFLRAVIPKDRTRPDMIADGMYLSVTCAEDVPFIDGEEAARTNASIPFGNYRVDQQKRACSMWPRGEIPPGYHDPVRSDVPVLLISGHMDPVAPPELAEEVVRHLPNGRHVIIPAAAHTPEGLSNLDCLNNLMLDFFAKADATNLHVACVAEMRPPPFSTDAATSQKGE